MLGLMLNHVSKRGTHVVKVAQRNEKTVLAQYQTRLARFIEQNYTSNLSGALSLGLTTNNQYSYFKWNRDGVL